MNLKSLLAIAVATISVGLVAFAQDPPPAPQQQGTIRLTLTGAPGLPPKVAVPDFIGEAAAGKTIGEVLWDDLDFEGEFYMVARDTYRSIPQPPSIDQVPLQRWKELGADGVVVGSVRREGSNLVVDAKFDSNGPKANNWGQRFSATCDAGVPVSDGVAAGRVPGGEIIDWRGLKVRSGQMRKP